jgi:hypothetical protein
MPELPQSFTQPRILLCEGSVSKLSLPARLPDSHFGMGWGRLLDLLAAAQGRAEKGPLGTSCRGFSGLSSASAGPPEALARRHR